MKYNILIKTKGYNKDLFKFYQVDGEIYETENLEELTDTYNELLESYTITQIFPIHNLDVKLNTEISEDAE
jgi:hypothetical protein